jgi:hypothetical protein
MIITRSMTHQLTGEYVMTAKLEDKEIFVGRYKTKEEARNNYNIFLDELNKVLLTMINF